MSDIYVFIGVGRFGVFQRFQSLKDIFQSILQLQFHLPQFGIAIYHELINYLRFSDRLGILKIFRKIFRSVIQIHNLNLQNHKVNL